MKFQLISLDEYRTTAILGTYDSPGEAITKARDAVTDVNVRNALASAERDKAWEAYFVDIFSNGKLDPKLAYAGFLPDGKMQKAYSFQEDGTFLVELAEGADTRIYLGQTETGAQWYLTDKNSKPVTNLSNPDFIQKTVYFLKAIS